MSDADLLSNTLTSMKESQNIRLEATVSVRSCTVLFAIQYSTVWNILFGYFPDIFPERMLFVILFIVSLQSHNEVKFDCLVNMHRIQYV